MRRKTWKKLILPVLKPPVPALPPALWALLLLTGLICAGCLPRPVVAPQGPPLPSQQLLALRSMRGITTAVKDDMRPNRESIGVQALGSLPGPGIAVHLHRAKVMLEVRFHLRAGLGV